MIDSRLWKPKMSTPGEVSQRPHKSVTPSTEGSPVHQTLSRSSFSITENIRPVCISEGGIRQGIFAQRFTLGINSPLINLRWKLFSSQYFKHLYKYWLCLTLSLNNKREPGLVLSNKRERRFMKTGLPLFKSGGIDVQGVGTYVGWYLSFINPFLQRFLLLFLKI